MWEIIRKIRPGPRGKNKHSFDKNLCRKGLSNTHCRWKNINLNINLLTDQWISRPHWNLEGIWLVALQGAVFSFIIEWDCNLDYAEEYCLPQYRFRRMDSPDEKIAKGWNFRHADYWNAPDGSRRRTLYKYYGIRFVFLVYGKAGRFSPEEFALNLGSGIGLLGLVSAKSAWTSGRPYNISTYFMQYSQISQVFINFSMKFPKLSSFVIGWSYGHPLTPQFHWTHPFSSLFDQKHSFFLVNELLSFFSV